jgi:aldehyde dehydrogenase (NAD+)
MPSMTTVVRDKLYIGGAWVPSTGTGSIDVIDSTTEEVIGTVPEGTTDDIDRAVAAARGAFPAWSSTPVAERAALLTAVSEALGARMDALGELITHEVGMPLVLSRLVQVGLPMASFGSMAQVTADFTWEQTVGNSLIVREPIGVVGAITPWNYPLHQIAAKVAPALAAGCTVVLKPSEVAPLNAFVLAEIFEEVGVPAGVFNLVTGFGPVVGEAIAAHPDVDMVSFTGSTRAGKRVSEVASATVKRVALELGGKSANVILGDADLAQAVSDGVGKCYFNSGQTCSALTRMLVPRDRLDEVVLRRRRSLRQRDPSRTAGVGRPARPGAQLHRQGCG